MTIPGGDVKGSGKAAAKKAKAPKEKNGKNRHLHAVIMAGGRGTRFWPVSRETFPKQFLRIFGEKTLLQGTIDRLDGELPPDNFTVVTTVNQAELVRWQTRDVIPAQNVITEPMGRNTAPAIALAAFKKRKADKNALLLVLPSDHYVRDTAAFISAIRAAVPFAEAGKLVTFGIVPTRPETGYGYIKAGKARGKGVFRVERFVEKPGIEKAREFVTEGSYLWNSGIFLFSARTVIEEIKKHMPALYKAFAGIEKHLGTAREQKAIEDAYGLIEEDSIDYGVLEKSKRVCVVRSDFGWSDIGSWNALEDVTGADHGGNVVLGNSVNIEPEGSIIFSSGRLLATIGLRGMAVVDTHDATLICPRDRVQEVKKLVEKLKQEGKGEYLLPSVEERPWGHFSLLEKGPGYQIKHICLKPKARLSLQMHNHRSEHWIVVSGMAKVQRGDEIFRVNKNESTYIPVAVKHRLENPGLIPLKIIEIQSGEYLGEDDIIRFDDVYGRETGR
ncbi:MAG: mannose-1-phosphate guanylyltransferase/mannose-6-phosphate isomerase [Nitrospiraceae bacterium]|nr:mannose-1-phosphate guanylyltransferase/mannose-6-phosphate isomerase [Nitrospiraceae bacterium]